MSIVRRASRGAGHSPFALALLAVVGAISATFGAPAAGQDPKLPPAFTATCKVLEVANGVIRVANDKAEEFYVQFDASATITLAGPIEESFLSPGTLVRFSAEFDERGAIQGEVKALTVVEQSVVVVPGAFRDGDPTAVAANKDKKKASVAGTYVVVGQVKSCKKGNLQVQVPGVKLIKAKLATDATLDIDVTDYWLARPDDEITVDGSLLQEMRVVKDKVQPGIVKAGKLDIKPAQPLTNQSKKKGKGKKAIKGKAKDKDKGKSKSKVKDGAKPGDTAPDETKPAEKPDEKPAEKPAEKPKDGE